MTIPSAADARRVSLKLTPRHVELKPNDLPRLAFRKSGFDVAPDRLRLRLVLRVGNIRRARRRRFLRGKAISIGAFDGFRQMSDGRLRFEPSPQEISQVGPLAVHPSLCGSRCGGI